MIQHHLVCLAADTGLLVTTECRVRGIRVVTVRPDTARLDTPAKAVCLVYVTGPDTGPEAVQRVVRDFHCLLGRIERGHRHHRPENLLLEHTHLVVSLEDGRLYVVTARD